MNPIERNIWAACFAVRLQERRRSRRHGVIEPFEHSVLESAKWAQNALETLQLLRPPKLPLTKRKP